MVVLSHDAPMHFLGHFSPWKRNTWWLALESVLSGNYYRNLTKVSLRLDIIASRYCRQLNCSFNSLFSLTIKTVPKLRITCLYEWHPPVTDPFPSQRASNEESASMWWRHHDTYFCHETDGATVVRPLYKHDQVLVRIEMAVCAITTAIKLTEWMAWECKGACGYNKTEIVF